MNLGNFSAGQGWITSSSTPFKSQSWTVNKTHSSQKVYGYSDIQGKAGVYSGQESKASAYVTLGAKTSYAVKYNANGGSGAPSAQTKWHGETLKLQSGTPTRTGYNFSGWNTKADGSGTSYAAGANYTGNAAVTLYAKWTAITYTVSYNANNGSGTMANQTKTHGTDLTLRTNTFTRTGYDFKNYNTKANGSGSSYSSGGKYTANAAATMYAQWTIKTYKVTYNANNGTGAPSAQTKTYNQALTLSSTKPTRTGYNFLGWSTSSTATAATYAAGGTLPASVNQATVLYAVWQVAAPSLTITNCFRADSTGAPADEGTLARVEASWSVRVASTLTWSCECNGDEMTEPFQSSTAADNLSGTVVFLLLNADMAADQEYVVTLSLTDSYGTTTKTDTISTAFFTIDVKAGGHGIAFGKPSTVDYLADFGMDVRAEKLFTAIGSSSTSNTGFYAQRTDTEHGIGLVVGGGGINRGLLDIDTNSWVIHINSNGNLVYDRTPHKKTSTADLTGGTATGKACWSNGICAGYSLRNFKVSAALASGSSVVIGTLPEGYRPTDYRYQMAYTNNATSCGRVMLAVNTNGAMTLYNQSGASLGTGVQIYVSDTYSI